MDDLADEAEDVFGVVFAVGVVGYAAALVGGDLVLVDDPFEGGAIAESVFVGLGRNTGEGEKRVVEKRSLVAAEANLFDAAGGFFVGIFDAGEGKFGLVLVMNV